MLHLNPKDSIAYIERLRGELGSLINQIERGDTTSQLEVSDDELDMEENVKFYPPLSFYILDGLLGFESDLLERYKSFEGSGLYISDTGFPSAPSFNANLSTLTNLLEKGVTELEKSIGEGEKAIGDFRGKLASMDTASIDGLGIKENELEQLEEEKASLDQKLAFLEVISHGIDLNDFFHLQECNSVIELSEEDKFFLLRETIRYRVDENSSEKDVWRGDNRLSRLTSMVKSLRRSVEDSIPLLKNGRPYAFSNALIARYFDPAIYDIERPFLIVFTKGYGRFSSSFKKKWWNEFPDTISEIRAGYHERREEIGTMLEILKNPDGLKSNCVSEVFTTNQDLGLIEFQEGYYFFERVEGLKNDLLLELFKSFPAGIVQSEKKPDPTEIIRLYESAASYFKLVERIPQDRKKGVEFIEKHAEEIKQLKEDLCRNPVYGGTIRNFIQLATQTT
ncbi:hypothetical protein KY347_00095 [Candidatus Woesearchaeota archaeon]|nr:hypothetical protein [Candidatus Woesearchaeota archaeon]